MDPATPFTYLRMRFHKWADIHSGPITGGLQRGSRERAVHFWRATLSLAACRASHLTNYRVSRESARSTRELWSTAAAKMTGRWSKYWLGGSFIKSQSRMASQTLRWARVRNAGLVRPHTLNQKTFTVSPLFNQGLILNPKP